MVALAIRPVPGSKTVSSSSVMPIAITVAPMIWLRAVIWLSTRPPSITETSQANAADAGCALAFLRHASEEQANERARGTGHRNPGRHRTGAGVGGEPSGTPRRGSAGGNRPESDIASLIACAKKNSRLNRSSFSRQNWWFCSRRGSHSRMRKAAQNRRYAWIATFIGRALRH